MTCPFHSITRSVKIVSYTIATFHMVCTNMIGGIVIKNLITIPLDNQVGQTSFLNYSNLSNVICGIVIKNLITIPLDSQVGQNSFLHNSNLSDGLYKYDRWRCD